ncbi:hypothetical protein RN001_002161 [Aquatica leii]|uniref:WW domain-containing protein n=1 Tax=Aquatica leii TaxID=1421715 RepID=A0AAN7QAY2_9COLE|nr:hypothetical protein RN001_002161 [Aquatica leii]
MEDITSTRQAVICEEVFDDSSQASAAEIRDYAAKIGIDPDMEPQLLPLAVEGLMKPLPAGWKPCYDDKKKAFYYHNSIIGKTQWEHPLDNIYRGLVMKARTESQSLSIGEPTEDATYTRDDLPSYEEPPPLPQYGFSRRDVKLSPLKARTKFTDMDVKLCKQKSEDRPSIANRKMNISLFTSFDEKLNDTQHNKEKGLCITGGGSMFLKSNTKKQNDILPPTPLQNKLENQNNLRGILRENSKSSDIDKLSVDKTDKEDDDRKIVRFNVESHSILSSEESENEDVKIQNEVDEIINVKITNTAEIPKSRFTVALVNQEKEADALPNLKLVKPDITKDCTFNCDILLSSDSEDFSIGNINKDKCKVNKIVDEELKKEKKDVKLSILDDTDFQSYRSEIYKQQKMERDKILVEEKSKHETLIKQQLESLRTEMNHRLNCALREEKVKLDLLMDEEKSKLKDQFEHDVETWEENLKKRNESEKHALEGKYKEKLLILEKELNEKLEKNKDELIVSHNAILDQIKQNHGAIINELQRDFKAEEDIIRSEHQKQISDLKNKVTREINLEKNRSKDVEEERLYEKVRCEKRLLEDKYRCLKDKYLKLKTEVKLSIEKRNRKREQILTATTTTTTTGSETERSPSEKKERTPAHSPSPNRKYSPKHARNAHDLSKHKNKIRQLIIQDQDTSASDHSYKVENKFNRNDSREYDSSDIDINPGRNRKKIFSRIKSSSASRINNNIKFRENQQRSCSPVENLRKQLQKLEDLEDQFPQNAQGDTYHLRYPFSDGQKFEGSSELEFFRHRIHLERDSIRRAKDSLKKQKTNFKQRQDELKLKYGPTARHTLQQLYQEEKELTDMEVSLHRTRSLLGEKVIRLRHLEQSLQRATISNDQQRQDDATLSDLSSHSASSGISSTEFATADSPALRATQFKESSEIIQSLENLNSEIKEIWDVLNKQQHASSMATVLPPLPLLYPDLGWPLLAGNASVPPSIPTLADRLQNYRQQVALANAQSTMVTHDTQGATTTLVEKTRNLRQWLRQTTIDNTVEGNTSQATL